MHDYNLHKNIALITLHTPTRENVRGASALPYHLAKHRPENIDLNIYTFNQNGLDNNAISEISENLNVSVKVIKPIFKTKFLRFCCRFIPGFRGILSYPLFHYYFLSKESVAEIKQWADNIWIYGEELAPIANEFPQLQCVVTTPDCEAMYYKRVFSMPSKLTSFGKILRYGRAYWQYLNVVKCFPTENVIYHLVGEADARFLSAINPNAKVVFLPHPHYEGNINRPIKFGSERIRLLLPGRYDIYSKDAVDEAINALVKHSEISHFYDITFQGKNWSEPASKLRDAGFKVFIKGFVQDYKEELCKYDIQLSPISLGSGTKGKVLDAFINGLLVIAPMRAIENIQVQDKEDFFFYTNENELINILLDVPKNIVTAESIANNGRNAVIEKHNPQLISNLLFQFFEAKKCTFIS